MIAREDAAEYDALRRRWFFVRSHTPSDWQALAPLVSRMEAVCDSGFWRVLDLQARLVRLFDASPAEAQPIARRMVCD